DLYQPGTARAGPENTARAGPEHTARAGPDGGASAALGIVVVGVAEPVEQALFLAFGGKPAAVLLAGQQQR
ncbi:uncharacterized protein PO1_contig-041-40, partial [Mycobacterium sp. PO1]